MAACYRVLARAIKNQKLRGGLKRLANYLITQHLCQGVDTTFIPPHEKRVLASLLGMTSENVCLADYGVEVNGAQVTIARPVVLERLAKPTPPIAIGPGQSGKAQREP